MEYNFRTREQMVEIYELRSKQGLSHDDPYIIELGNAPHKLIFCGTRHLNQPTAKQYQVIQELWNGFLELEGRKIAICEGGKRTVDGISMEDAIRTDGDPGYMCWLAAQAGIECISPEPDRKAEIDALIPEFGVDKTLLYYFARVVDQWIRSDHKTYPDLDKFITTFVHRYENYLPEEYKLNEKKLYEIFEQETGKTFSKSEGKVLNELSDPTKNPVSSRCTELRDEMIFSSIKRHLEKENVFVVFGSGHAITMEPALRELFD